jgi:hypothetical protein
MLELQASLSHRRDAEVAEIIFRVLISREGKIRPNYQPEVLD